MKNRKGYQLFLFILQNTQEVESERRKGGRDVLKEWKGHLYNVCIFDHLSLNFVAFVTVLM